MRRINWLFGVMLLLLGASAFSASAKLNWDDKEFMSVREISPGMRGYGKSVFQGTKIETFNIEVVGILRKIDFGFDMILIKVLDGPVVDRKLQTVAGMSGSPIYIDGRLIGAYAYGFSFQQEPLAGVTPISAMLDCTEPGSADPSLTKRMIADAGGIKIGGKLFTGAKIATNAAEALQLKGTVTDNTLIMTPVATPVFINGMNERALKPLQQIFDKYNLQAAPGPGGRIDEEAPQLEAGSAVGISLMSGDSNMAAVGTVTYVKDDTVLCFGHPFMGRGDIDMPLSVCYIDGIVSSALSSFKLGSPIGKPVGTATSDRKFALAGKVGQVSETIKGLLYLKDDSRSLDTRYAVEVINDPEFAPILLYLYFMVGGAADLGDVWGSGEGTYTGKTVMSTDKYGDISFDSVFAPEIGSWDMPMFELYALSGFLMRNKYESVKINQVYVNMSFVPGRNFATIEKIIPDRLVARPGEDVNFTVKIRPYGKPVEEKIVKVHIPENTVDQVMGVIIAGGSEASSLKSMLTAVPDQEEGVKGIIRYLQGNPTSNNMLVLKASPSPSYDYRGHKITNIPTQIVGILRESDLSIGNSNGDDMYDRGFGSSSIKPTATLDVTPMPYILSGGGEMIIQIQTDESMYRTGRTMTDMIMSGSSPFLSTAMPNGSTGAGTPGGPAGPSDYEGEMSVLNSSMTKMQREQLSILKSNFSKDLQPRHVMTLPHYATVNDSPLLPLSIHSNTPDSPPAKPDAGNKPGAPNEPSGEASRPGGSTGGTDPITLTAKENAWGLRTRNDFLRGKHIGTGVNSKGELTLVPAMRNIYTATDTNVITNRVVSTANGTYIAGWGTNKVTCIKDDGTIEIVFPKDAADGDGIHAITSLVADMAGNLIVASWPDMKVRRVTPNGNITTTWRVPGDVIWNMAITSEGVVYAAADQGSIFILHDDGGVQLGATAPDKLIYAMTAGPGKTLYLATSPRGKVYRLNKEGYLEAVCEGEGPVASLLVAADGTLFIGSASNNSISRVLPNGTRKVIMRGIGNEDSITDIKMIGEVLYASSSPGGGLYCIEKPMDVEPVVIPVYARQDLRDGTDENASVGPESIMVNAMAVSAKGELFAVTSAPSQVLKMEPRTSGTFISHVLTVPSVSKWGQVEIRSTVKDKQQIVVETRGGLTATPDETWSNFALIGKDGDTLTSAPAPNSQLRVTLTGTGAASPNMDFVKVHYLPLNNVPIVMITVPAGSIWHEKHNVRWMGRDIDGDKVVYTVFSTSDDGKTWVPVEVKLAKPEPKPKPATTVVKSPVDPKAGKVNKHAKADITKQVDVNNVDAIPDDAEVTADPDASSDTSNENEPNGETSTDSPDGISATSEESTSKTETFVPNFMWDTKKAADGIYCLKIVASDKYAKPTDAKAAESISTPFIIDNTPPVIDVADNVANWDEVSRLNVEDNLCTIVGGRYQLDNGQWIALVAEDGIFNSKEEWVLLISPDGKVTLTGGEHKLTLQVKDLAGNVLTKKLTIGGKPVVKPVTPPTPPKNAAGVTAPAPQAPKEPKTVAPTATTEVNHKTWQGEDSAALADVLFFSLQN